MQHRLSSLLVGLIGVASVSIGLSILSGCGGSMNFALDAPPHGSSNVSYPQGWDHLDVHANWTKSMIDSNGHFTTDRNWCGRETYGTLDVQTWNKLNDALNHVATLTISGDPACYDMPPGKFDGYADLILEDKSKRSALEVRGGKLCTPLKDAAIAQELIQAMESAVDIADREDCPNAPPNH